MPYNSETGTNYSIVSAPALASVQVSAAGIGTPANTNQTTLMSYTLPANTLSANGKAIRVRIFGNVANNSNGKTVYLNFGPPTTFGFGQGTSFNYKFYAEMTVIRTGAGAQWYFVQSEIGNASVSFNGNGTLSNDETQPIVITFQGANSAASANDILANAMIVEFLN